MALQGTGQETTLASVTPLLHAPEPAPVLSHFAPDAPGRERLERFIHSTFAQAYAADVRAFCAHLLAFERGDGLRGVVGLRPAQDSRLYSESYLDAAAEARVASRTGLPVMHLYEQGDYHAALYHAECALDAPPRVNRPLADAGRRQEIEQLIMKVNAEDNHATASAMDRSLWN